MDPRLIQKQVKDNVEDLNVFMKDMKVWEADMKRKECELLQNDTEPQNLPPIRNKKKKSKAESAKTTKDDKEVSDQGDTSSTQVAQPKKISGFDYAAWNRFDVDKACAEVDEEESEESESDSDEDGEVDSEQRLRDEAIYEKEKGNQLVRKRKYAEAIACYSRAIECYPYDAIYHANRGLCYIKTNDFQSAETDCSKSLELDDTYVKAYQRRAAARIALGRFFDAKSDLEKVMEYEPMNTDAKSELIKLEKTIKVSKPKQLDAVVVGASKIRLLEQGSGEPAGTKSKSNSKGNVKTVLDMKTTKPIHKIEIQNSKDGPPNQPVSSTTAPSAKITELPNSTPATLSSQKNIGIASQNIPPTKKEPSPKNVPKSVTVDDENDVVPSKPKSSVEFLLGWRRVKPSAKQSFTYLKQINGSEIPVIFQESLECTALSDIISVLKTEFLPRKEPVYHYLLGISKVKRLSALTMFMSDADKKGVTLLLESSVTSGECSAEEANILKQKFEL